MPCGLHCAISGIRAGGILGFGTADRLLVFTPPPRSCLVVWLMLLAFCKIQFISSIHWHISCLSCDRARPSRRGVFGFCFVLVCVFLFGLFLLVCLLFFSSLDTPVWTTWTAYWSTLFFDFPMREHTGLCTIRSMAQTLCYDLARAEGEGRKKNSVSKNHISFRCKKRTQKLASCPFLS